MESTRLQCGGCEQGLVFGFQLELEGGDSGEKQHQLFHADGTEMCAVPEPAATAPGVLWPQLQGVPYVPGRVGAVTPTLRTYVDPPEERDRPPMMGVLLLFVALVALVVTCGAFVYAWFPWGTLR